MADNKKAYLNRLTMRALYLIPGLLMTLAVSLSVAAEVEFKSSYLFDLLVTNNWEMEFSYAQPLSEKLKLKGIAQYLGVNQDEIGGIRRLEAGDISGLGGISWMTLRDHAVVDLGAGVDHVPGFSVKPRLELKLVNAIPMPTNGFLSRPRLQTEGWYRHRISNAAAVKNRISSKGYSIDLTAGILSKIDFGTAFRQEWLKPHNALLDTSLKEPVPGGVPFDTLKENRLSSFYVYGVVKIFEVIDLGYAFSWSDADFSRNVVTSSTPVIKKNRFIGTAYEYLNYPYSAFRDAIAHSLVVAAAVPLGQNMRLSGKAAVPLYSRRQEFSAPGFISAGQPADVYMFYYDQEYTAPLTLNTKLFVRISDNLSTNIDYEYFSLPYGEWQYFSRDNSYSYHKFGAAVNLNF